MENIDMKPVPPMRDDAIAFLLRDYPAFANYYLTAALDMADREDGLETLHEALRQVAEARGMYSVAVRAGIPRESLYRALSPGGDPTVRILLAVLDAAGLKLGVYPRPHADDRQS